MTRKQRTMLMVVCLMIGLGIATTLALKAFNENLLYFISPTDISDGKAPDGRAFRLGGMVAENSIVRAGDSLKIHFDVTDYANTVVVEYEGILPDLFREGQGIIANGRLTDDGVFVADDVLAKHDENYMPPDVADALEKGKQQVNKEALQP